MVKMALDGKQPKAMWRRLPSIVLRLLALCLVWVGMAMAQRVVIDGNLNDRLWRDLPASRLVPSEDGTPADLGGEIRAIVAGRYLYLCARLTESTGRVTARLTGRNPSWEDEDRIRILAVADIGYTDRILTINPFGAYSIEKAVPVAYRNEPTFPYADEWSRDVVYANADKFLVAASVGEKEWTVEAAIPLNELSAPGSSPILLWVERIRAARPGAPRERWRSPQYGPAAKVPVDRSVKWDAAAPEFRPTLMGNKELPLEVGRRKTLPALDSGWNDDVWNKVPAWKLLRDEPLAQLPRTPTEVKQATARRTNTGCAGAMHGACPDFSQRDGKRRRCESGRQLPHLPRDVWFGLCTACGKRSWLPVGFDRDGRRAAALAAAGVGQRCARGGPSRTWGVEHPHRRAAPTDGRGSRGN